MKKWINTEAPEDGSGTYDDYSTKDLVTNQLVTVQLCCDGTAFALVTRRYAAELWWNPDAGEFDEDWDEGELVSEEVGPEMDLETAIRSTGLKKLKGVEILRIIDNAKTGLTREERYVEQQKAEKVALSAKQAASAAKKAAGVLRAKERRIAKRSKVKAEHNDAFGDLFD